MQEGGNHPLFVETAAPRKVQDIDSIELVVFAFVDEPSYGVCDCRIGSLL
jgi:hypothetical protein